MTLSEFLCDTVLGKTESMQPEGTSLSKGANTVEFVQQ